jgi:hypothetical protein
MVKGGEASVEIFTITEAGRIHIDFACAEAEPAHIRDVPVMVTLVDITASDGRVGVMDHFSDVVLERRIRPGLCRLAVEATHLPPVDLRPYWGEDYGETYRVTVWPKDQVEQWVTRHASAHAMQRLELGLEWPRPADWVTIP